MAYKRELIVNNGSLTSYKKLLKVSDVCQLLNKSKYLATSTVNGVTYTNNGDGIVTVNGTATANATFNLIYKADLLTTIGHKYLLMGCPVGRNGSSTYFLRYDSDGGTMAYDIGNGVIFRKTSERIAYINIRVYTSYTANNLVFKPQLFDLTEMFGSGNEPKTVAEFKQKFPDELYPYSPNCWITSYKNVSKVADVCQLLDKKEYNSTETINGVTFTNNGDGSYTLNGTCNTSANYNVVQSIIPIIKNHTYLLVDNRSKKISDDSNATVQIINSATTYYFQTLNLQGSNAYTIVKATDSWMCFLRIRIEVNLFYDNVKLLPQLYDLTEMYGEGKEPKTVEEFRAKFPNEMYDYNLCCTV